MRPVGPDEQEPLSADRARSMGRLLVVDVVLAVVLLIVSLVLLATGAGRYGGIVLGIAVVLEVLGMVSLRLTRRRSPAARRLAIITGVAMLVLSVPLVEILVGLLTAVAGIGLLVVTVAPERDDR
jgi:hypothetical protein